MRENSPYGALEAFFAASFTAIGEHPMNDTLTPELWQAERARRATRNAAIAALAAFALSRREDFERFLADGGEEPGAFIERWADAWRLRQAAITQFGLAGGHAIATRRAYAYVTALLKFVAEDLDDVGDSGELLGQLKEAGLYGRKNRQGYIDPSSEAEHRLRNELAAALRGLIDSGELPLNRRGAAGWRIGNDLWLAGKRVAAALRAHPRFAGHHGIPADSMRLFDLLRNQGLLVPDPEGRAFWRATVKGDGWAHFLTLLRFPIDWVWTGRDTAPPEASMVAVESALAGQDDSTRWEADQEGANPVIPSISME
jgi:hypothetical protein